MGKKIYLLVNLDDAFGKANKGDGGQGGFDERFGLERDVSRKKVQVMRNCQF